MSHLNGDTFFSSIVAGRSTIADTSENGKMRYEKMMKISRFIVFWFEFLPNIYSIIPVIEDEGKHCLAFSLYRKEKSGGKKWILEKLAQIIKTHMILLYFSDISRKYLIL